MEVTVFKTINCRSEKINAVTQSSKHLLVVNCDSINLYTIQNFRHLISFDFSYDCSLAKFLNDKIAVLVSQNKLIFYEIHQNIYKIIEHQSDIKFMEIQNEIVFVNTQNQIYKLESSDLHNFEIYMVDTVKERLIQNEKDNVTAIKVCNNSIVYANDSGYIKIYTKNKNLIEYFCSQKKINNICEIDDKIAMVTNDGSLLVFDIKNGILLDDIQVRDTPLYAIGIIGTNIFCAGEDNRLINYELVNDKLCRRNQTDTHNAPVFDILINKNRIITIGKDNTIVAHELRDQGFCFRKITTDKNLLKTANDKFVICNKNKITINRIDGIIQKSNECFYDEHDYTCLYEITNNKNIHCFDISKDGTCLVYSTSQKTVIYHIHDKNCTKLMTIEPAYQVCLFKNFLCYVNMQKRLIIVDIKSNKEVFSLFLNDYEDRLEVGCDFILLTNTKAIINEKMEIRKINIADYIEKAVFDSNFIYLLTQNQEYNVNTSYKIVQYDLNTQETKVIVHLHSILRVDNFLLHNNKIICNDFDSVFITDIKTNVTKKEFW